MKLRGTSLRGDRRRPETRAAPEMPMALRGSFWNLSPCRCFAFVLIFKTLHRRVVNLTTESSGACSVLCPVRRHSPRRSALRPSCLAPPIPEVARVSGAAPAAVLPHAPYACDDCAGLCRLRRPHRQGLRLPRWPRAEWLLSLGDVGLLGMRNSFSSGRLLMSARAEFTSRVHTALTRMQLVKIGQH